MKKPLIAIVSIPIIIIVMLFGLIFTTDTVANPDCDLSGEALVVDPGSVPDGPIAGYSKDQLVNAANIMLAAQKLGLSARDQQIGVMTAMGESGLRVLDYGDNVGPDSRGLFQQRDNGAWGSYEDRMNPFISATNFFRVEMSIEGRDSMEPTLVANAVQRNADPWHYARWWEPAGAVVRGLGGISPANDQQGSPASRQTDFDVKDASTRAIVVANTLGKTFGLKTVRGGRASQTGKETIDFHVDDIPDGPAVGARLADHARENFNALGIETIQWNGQMWSAERSDEGWRALAGEAEGKTSQVRVHLVQRNEAVHPECLPESQFGDVSTSGWAAPSNGPITSDFGPRKSPGGIGSTWHRGIDLGPGCHAPIWASNSGRVVRSGPAGGYGNLIEIDHGSGARTRYGHMFNNGVLVKIGDQVSAGQQIGKVGNTGRSTGCHLHFEILVDGKHVDPEVFFQKVGVEIK